MPNYRRPRITGASVFFTVTLADRGSDLLLREVAALRRAVAQTRAERPFGIEAWVVLPDHMHCVWCLPVGDADYSTRWGAIKARFTRDIRDGCRVGFNPTIAKASGHAVGWNPTLRLLGAPHSRAGRLGGTYPVLLVVRSARKSIQWIDFSDERSKTQGEAWICGATGAVAVFIGASGDEGGAV